MKNIGLVGGLGPESTIYYYKKLISSFNTMFKDFTYPNIIIYSANLKELFQLISCQRWDKLSEWLLQKINYLADAGADFAAISSNTPHIVFNEVNQKTKIPLISIVEKTCDAAEMFGVKRIGLMGTMLTMESGFYSRVFNIKGKEIVIPSTNERNFIQKKLSTEIEFGNFKKSTKNKLLEIIKRMIDEEKIDSIILGCTELPLILPDSEFGIPFLNTSEIHCDSIIKYCIKD